MENAKSGPSASRIALANYSLSLAAAALLAFTSFYSGDAPGLVAIKCIIGLFFLTCLRGVSHYFKEPVVEARLTARAVEHCFLNAAVISAFISLIVWRPELTGLQVLSQFGIGIAAFCALNALGLRYKIREAASRAGGTES